MARRTTEPWKNLRSYNGNHSCKATATTTTTTTTTNNNNNNHQRHHQTNELQHGALATSPGSLLCHLGRLHTFMSRSRVCLAPRAACIKAVRCLAAALKGSCGRIDIHHCREAWRSLSLDARPPGSSGQALRHHALAASRNKSNPVPRFDSAAPLCDGRLRRPSR